MPPSSGSGAATSDRPRIVAVLATMGVLILIVLVFAVMRVIVDGPNITAGTVPPEGSLDRNYALHPVLAYAHILPGVLYLVGAPFQLSRGFRARHLAWHRRMGRVVLPAGVVAGVFAFVFGMLFPFGGVVEASATAVFAVYFVTALIIAFLAVKNGDITRHRRWMIRAFAIGLAVGTIRIWIGVFQALGLLSFQDSFGVAFWLSFVLHALVAEVYLRKRPSARGRHASALARRS
ncbi:MAG TPA: DUF2306 domain-containing protein [Pseudonocardiaceae bacterium]|jgi:uncharacterized membrane protein YozB (DUF420 family)